MGGPPHRWTADRPCGLRSQKRSVGGCDAALGGQSGVARVVGGDAHDRAGAVLVDDVVGLDHGQWHPGEGMGPDGARGGMADADGQECGRGKRVGPGGEHGEVAEVDLAALAPADPGPLEFLGPLGPVQGIQPGNQAVCVGGHAQEPLAHHPLGHVAPAPLTAAAGVFGLLPGQHRQTRRTPQDRGVGLVHEASAEQLDKQPLSPAVVGRLARVDGPGPVPGSANVGELTSEVRLGACGKGPGMLADGDGVVLGVDPEGVEAHGLEHGPAPHPLVATKCVQAGVPEDMANV
jgi:hypothetical protein